MRHPLTAVVTTAAFATALFVSLTLTALAQEDTPEPDPDEFIPDLTLAELDIAELAKRVTYPEEARKGGLEGTVVVRVLVDEEGNPRKYRIDHTDDPIFCSAAVSAVMSIKFEPGRQGDTPVKCWVSVPIKFQLK